jgi:hypothetical protein
MREVRLDGYCLSVFDEPGIDGSIYSGRLFYRIDGEWSPPLPPDIELPTETRRSASAAGVLMRSEPVPRPSWWLDKPRPSWRL